MKCTFCESETVAPFRSICATCFDEHNRREPEPTAVIGSQGWRGHEEGVRRAGARHGRARLAMAEGRQDQRRGDRRSRSPCSHLRCRGPGAAQAQPGPGVQHLGANGRATVDGGGATVPPTVEPTVEDEIKSARLQQLALSNAKARAEAAAQSGRYVLAADARQQMGRVAARLMAVFESSFTEFANAIMAAPPATSRDALRTLRAVWREIRIRQAKTVGDEAAALPPLQDDEDGKDADSERTAARA
jgi:hypothetical protein